MDVPGHGRLLGSGGDLFGVPFEFWSLALFAVIALAAASLVLRAVRVETA